MQTNIHPELRQLESVQEAETILRSCVHCGFCTATCPTYTLLGDELDGPRGRIYLIKNLLEENTIDARSTEHLDRCLTCRACETTCPSGVEYGRLLDIGRELVVDRAGRPLRHRVLAILLRLIIPRSYLFKPLLKVGQFLRPIMPRVIRDKVPQRKPAISPVVNRNAHKKVVLLEGCVQSAATPEVNNALRVLLADKGIECLTVAQEGCCGALDYHLSAHEQGRARMRQLIDQLQPYVSSIDHIVSSASGCGVTVKEYPDYLRQDPTYIAKSQQIADMTIDVSELMHDLSFSCADVAVAVHEPCSLQHGQKISGKVNDILQRAGARLVEVKESHLCCGSAGSYSILQPELSNQLKERKLAALQQDKPEVIVTANIGCELHLQTAQVPVMHWVEFLHRYRA